MFENALRKLFRQVAYIQLDREWIKIRDVLGKREIKDAPLMAISRECNPRTIVAVGANSVEASDKSGALLVKPLSHPRSLLSDFSSTEHLLKYFVKQLYSGSLLKPSPVVIIHPIPTFEGNYTQIEVRALKELGFAVGASKVHIWAGRTLTDEEAAEEDFPKTGGELLESPLLSA